MVKRLCHCELFVGVVINVWTHLLIICSNMALQQLVEGECGGANPFVQWTSHFSQSKPLANVIYKLINYIVFYHYSGIIRT